MAPHLLSGSRAEYYAATLAGKLINLCSEMPQKEVIESETFKAAITGDSISGRHPAGKPFTFKARAAWIIAANQLPTVRDTTYGFWRRPLVLTFPNTFKGKAADKNLRATLKAELPGILAWAVEGARRLEAQGTYTALASSDEAIQEWKADSDSVATFAKLHLESTRGEPRIKATDLFEVYKEWCKAFNYHPVNLINFGKRLTRAGVPGKAYRKGKYYHVKVVDHWKVTDDEGVEEALVAMGVEDGKVVRYTPLTSEEMDELLDDVIEGGDR